MVFYNILMERAVKDVEKKNQILNHINDMGLTDLELNELFQILSLVGVNEEEIEEMKEILNAS